MRSMVEGARRPRDDPFGDCVRVAHHLCSAHAKDRQSPPLKEKVASFIAEDSCSVMRISINLDDETGLTAEKIHDIGLHRVLAPELETGRPRAKYLP